MSETFSFVAPAMPRRRIDPFVVKLGVLGLVATMLIAAFSAFVVEQERSADQRREALQAQARADEQRQAAALTAQGPATASTRGPAASGAVASLLDEQARATVDRTVTLVQQAAGPAHDFASADATSLSDAQPSLLFVDGPSTAPSIVSVWASQSAWAGAVMGPSGTCYWVTVLADGSVRYGEGAQCTGQAALAADRVAR